MRAKARQIALLAAGLVHVLTAIALIFVRTEYTVILIVVLGLIAIHTLEGVKNLLESLLGEEGFIFGDVRPRSDAAKIREDRRKPVRSRVRVTSPSPELRQRGARSRVRSRGADRLGA